MSGFSITTKLGLSLGGFAALFIYSSVTGYGFLKQFESHLSQIATVVWPVNIAAHKMEINATEVGLRVEKYLRQPDPEQRKLLAGDVADFNNSHAIYMGLAFNDQQKSLLTAAKGIFSSYFELANRLFELKDASTPEANSRINEIFPQFVARRSQLDSMFDEDILVNTTDYIQAINQQQRETLAVANRTFLMRTGAWIVISILTLIFVARGIVLPLRRMSAAAARLSARDFSQRVEWRAKDELGNFASTFNLMAERLQAAYEKLRRANSELDVKVTDRTIELADANAQLNTVNNHLNAELRLRKQTEKKLRAALAAAESANSASKAKTLFLGHMSHELRTPLNAIIGFSDIIQQQMFGPSGHPKYGEYANDINQSGMHLLSLINNLLDISCIESGKLSLDDEIFDLASVLSTCLRMLGQKASERAVTLIDDVDKDFPMMHGDPTRVQQIFSNLICNAIKFTPAGGSVSLRAGQLTDGALQITVADTGIGIAPKDLPWVLQAFGQLKNDLARAHEGAGLGLPLAKSLTEYHDGRFEITSELGHGTTVTVTFPANRVVLRELSAA